MEDLISNGITRFINRLRIDEFLELTNLVSGCPRTSLLKGLAARY